MLYLIQISLRHQLKLQNSFVTVKILINFIHPNTHIQTNLKAAVVFLKIFTLRYVYFTLNIDIELPTQHNKSTSYFP